MPADHNPNSVPFGNGTVVIGAATYKVNSRSPGPVEATDQVIHESDHEGKAQPGRYAIIDGEELLEDSIVVQKDDDTAVIPARGDTMTDDYDDEGTPSSFTVRRVTPIREKNAPMQWEIARILDTYQG